MGSKGWGINGFREAANTVVRHIEGDIEEFQKELAKVTSNAPQKLKVRGVLR